MTGFGFRYGWGRRRRRRRGSGGLPAVAVVGQFTTEADEPMFTEAAEPLLTENYFESTFTEEF